MANYLFILGRKDDLAYYELQTVLSRLLPSDSYISKKTKHTATVNTSEKINPNELIAQLGGTIKIAKLGKSVSQSSLLSQLVKIFRNESMGKSRLTFGLSIINPPQPGLHIELSNEVKSALKQESINSRYLLSKQSSELSSAQVSLSQMIELYLIFANGKIMIAKTLAIQDFASFSMRDYGRPFSDPKAGMLPPKVARMMINIALTKKQRNNTWILDPFCGTGTIGMEAYGLGINCLNSDVNLRKVSGTKQNLNWLSNQIKTEANWKVFLADATQVSNQVKIEVNAIVTEPYLGPPVINENEIHNMVKGLNKLYLGALKNWKKCLINRGRVVMIVPEIRVGRMRKAATLAIDMRENVGYTLVAGPLEYDRQHSRVKRLIYVLEKK